METEKRGRFSLKHDESTGILTIICTKELVVKVHELLTDVCPIEYMSSERFIQDTWNDQGELFEDCVVIKFKVGYDVIDIFFEAGKMALRKSISDSINHNEN